MIGFGKIGQNGRFGAKIDKFWAKKGKKVKFPIFSDDNFFAIFLKTKKLKGMRTLFVLQVYGQKPDFSPQAMYF